jgi:hypothetical protein
MSSNTSETAPENSNNNNRSGSGLVRRPVAKKLENTLKQRLSGKLEKKKP